MRRKANPIEIILSELLLPLGFRKNGKSWHLIHGETVWLVGLQKSNWGNQFYVNLGVVIRGLSENLRPKANECHIGTRLKLPGRHLVSVSKALDLENFTVTDRQRKSVLEQAMRTHGLPFLKDFESVSQIRKTLRNKDVDRLAIRNTVYEFMSNRK